MFSACVKESNTECDDTDFMQTIVFVYDYNEYFEDLFDDHLTDLAFYYYDENGTIVREYTLECVDLEEDRVHYVMLPYGRYSLTVWGNVSTDHYEISDHDLFESMTLSVADSGGYVDSSIPDLFHANIAIDARGPGKHYVSFVRDTNIINVTLDWSALATRAAERDYGIEIFGSNGVYGADNSFMSDRVFFYNAQYESTPNQMKALFKIMRLTSDCDVQIKIENKTTSSSDNMFSDYLTNVIRETIEGQYPEMLKSIDMDELLDRYYEFNLVFEISEEDGSLVARPVIEIGNWEPVIPPGTGI